MVLLAEYPTIRELDLGTRAHLAQSMAPWWTAQARRGTGVREKPGVDGGFARPVRTGPVRFVFEVWVDGRYDTAGTPLADPREGWRTNLGLLEDACAPASSKPWTFEAVHHLPDGGTRTAQIQVLDIVTPQRQSGVAGIVGLRIQVPTGEFVYQAPA